MADDADKIKWWREHAEALERNWHTHVEACLSTIYESLELTDGSVPEAVEAVERLRQQRDALLSACRAIEAELGQIGGSPYDKVRDAITLCKKEKPK